MSQKFVDEVSPDLSGRKRVAHGVSRGYANPPSPPPPLPPARVSRSAGRGEGFFPQGWRPGLSRLAGPLPGLWNGHPKREDFVS
jgi:hypothetical protein